MTRHVYHITQRPDGRWEGRRQGFRRVSILSADRQVVEDRIRALAAKNNFSVLVHERPEAGPHGPVPATADATIATLQEV